MADRIARLTRRQGAKGYLVGLWDCVAFDEVAGIHFKDKDGVQIIEWHNEHVYLG